MVQSLEFSTQEELRIAWPVELRPNPDSPPSIGWINGLKTKAIRVHQLITEADWKALMEQAAETSDEDDDEFEEF